MEGPNCGKCGKLMTPRTARLRPELFLHDECLPDELRSRKAEVKIDKVNEWSQADWEDLYWTIHLFKGRVEQRRNSKERS